MLCTNCAHKAFSIGVTFGREAVVSPRRLGTFRRSPKAVDAPTAPTAPADEASGPFGSDSLAFDSPAQSPSARPKKPRPSVFKGTAHVNGADTRKSPLAEEVTSDAAGHGTKGIAANHTQSPNSAPAVHKAPAQHTRPHSGTNGVKDQHTAAPREVNAPTSARPAVMKGAVPTGPSEGLISAVGKAKTPNGVITPADSHAAKAPGAAASQHDLFSGNHAAGDSNAATPRFADSATAFTNSSESHAGAARTNGVISAPQHQGGNSVPPAQQSSPTKAVPAASLVSAVPTSGPTQPSGKQLPSTMAGSAPDSPKTPRDGPGRDTLTVESCQLNTGSSVQPQPAFTSQQEPRHRSPPARPTSGPVTSYPGPASMSPPPSGSVPYAAAYQGVTPPSSAPGFMVGRHSPSAVNAHGSPMRSPRSATRPRTPTSLSRRGVSANYPPPEALEELGSTFLKYPGVLPHFMRPTAAHEYRLKAEPDDTRSASPPARRPRSVAPNAHFIQPTASYVAKVAHAPSESSTPKRALSACVVWSPQLQPTCVAVFLLTVQTICLFPSQHMKALCFAG